MKTNSVQHEHFQSIIANKPIPSQLVGGFNHLEKYEFVNGKDDIPYMKWKINNVPNHQPDNQY